MAHIILSQRLGTQPNRHSDLRPSSYALNRGALLWTPQNGEILRGAPNRYLAGARQHSARGLECVSNRSGAASSYAVADYADGRVSEYHTTFALVRVYASYNAFNREIVRVGTVGSPQIAIGVHNNNQLVYANVYSTSVGGAGIDRSAWTMIAVRRGPGVLETFAHELHGGYRGYAVLTGATSSRPWIPRGEIRVGTPGTLSLAHPYGECALVFAIPGVVSDSELLRVLGDPWGLFSARVRIVPMSSGVPTLSFPGVTDITPGSARPKVTLTF